MTDKFIPADQTPYVRDLDAIVSDPIGIKLHGRVRMLKPIETMQFLKFMNQWQEFGKWQREVKDATPNSVIDKLHNLLNTVCDDISKEDIEKMTNSQVAAVIDVVFKTISGEIFVPQNDDEVKKKMRMRLSDMDKTAFPHPN